MTKAYADGEFIKLCTALCSKLLLITIGGSPGDVSEELMTYEKRKKGWRMSCDLGEVTEGLENEL